MANTVLVAGTYNNNPFATFATQGDDGYVYWTRETQFRLDPSQTTANGESYVQKNTMYYPSERWINMDGYNVAAIGYSTDSGTSGGGGTGMVEKALDWAVGIANDESHGYDWDNRLGPDYDCSSLVNHAYYNAGFNVDPAAATFTMRQMYQDIGFTVLGPEVANDVNSLKRGDILLQDDYHTEIYLGNGMNVGAHSNEFGGVQGGVTGDQTGREICVDAYWVYSYPSAGVYGWSCVLRPPQESTDWTEWKDAKFTSYEVGGVAGWSGTPIEADSMGVACPCGLGITVPPNPNYPELYYGQLVQLEIEGKYFIALINDCGNFGQGNTYNQDVSLDLQPGIWGQLSSGMVTYTGRYRIVGSIPYDSTNGKGPWYVV